MEITPHLTQAHFGHHNHKGFSKLSKATIKQLTTFIQLQKPIQSSRGLIPVCHSFKEEKAKDELIEIAVDWHFNCALQTRHFKHQPEPEIVTELVQ